MKQLYKKKIQVQYILTVLYNSMKSGGDDDGYNSHIYVRTVNDMHHACIYVRHIQGRGTIVPLWSFNDFSLQNHAYSVHFLQVLHILSISCKFSLLTVFSIHMHQHSNLTLP